MPSLSGIQDILDIQDTRCHRYLGYKIGWIYRIQDAITIWDTRYQRLRDGMRDALGIWDTSRDAERAGQLRFR